MRPDAPCYGEYDIFGAGKTWGDPEQAKALCAECPVGTTVCLTEFVRLHGKPDGITGGMTIAGRSGGELQRAIERMTNRQPRRRVA